MKIGGVSGGPLECDVVDAMTGEKLHTISLTRVPRVGEELDIDSGGRDARDDVYQVMRVRYHVRRRKIVKIDDLIGVSLYVEHVL